MALQSSGTITLAQIQTEFGGSNPISLSEYYRGGSLVPDTATNSGIPTSGAIALNDFYGAAAGSNDLTITIGNSGSVYGYIDGTYGSVDNDTLTNSETIERITSQLSTGKVTLGTIIIGFDGDTTSSAPFTSVTFYNSQTLNESNATENYNGTTTTYTWTDSVAAKNIADYMDSYSTVDVAFSV